MGNEDSSSLLTSLLKQWRFIFDEVKLVKSKDHHVDLEKVFETIRTHNIPLNPKICFFKVKGENFIGFMITQHGIGANLDKCEVILSMRSPEILK